MAISFVGSAVGSSSPTTGTVVTLPGGMAANDLIVVAAAVGDTVSNGMAAPTQGGYTRVPGVAATLYANDTNDVNLDLYYKLHNGTDTQVSFTGVGGTNASNAAVVQVFRGVDTTTPFDTNANTATGIDTSNANPPSHNWSGTAGVWTVIAGATGHTGGATASFTFPAGYTTNAAQQAHNDTIDVLVGMGYRTNPADPEDPAAFTAATIGTASANSWAAVTMSLKESVSSPVTVTPGTAALVLTTFVAVVTVTANVTVTPGAASLALSAFAPTVSTSDHKTVVPGTLTVSLATFTPTVATTANVFVTPGVVALTITRFTPNVTVAITVIPDTVTLALTTFTPLVSTSDHKIVVPGVSVLSLTTFDPAAIISGGGPVAIVEFIRVLRTRRR